MSHTLKKEEPYVNPGLAKNIKKIGAQGNTFKIWSRGSTITKEMVGASFLIHNGKEFKKRLILSQMVGRKIGEFVLTRRAGKHGKAGKRSTKH